MKNLNGYLIWIPVTVIYNFLCCYVSVKYKTDLLKTYMFLVLCGLIPTWTLATWYSKNLILDSVIFDMTLVISSIFILTFLGQAQTFTLLNWVGVCMCIIGLLIVRM